MKGPPQEATTSKQLMAGVETTLSMCVTVREVTGKSPGPSYHSQFVERRKLTQHRSWLVQIFFPGVSAFLKPSSRNEKVFTVPPPFDLHTNCYKQNHYELFT